MANKHGLSTRIAVRAWWLAVALGCVSLNAHAQKTFSEKVWWSTDPQGMRANVEQALGRTPTATLPPAGTPAVNGGKISNLAGEWPTVQSRAPGPFAGTRGATFDVQGRIVPGTVGGALTNFVRKVGPLANAAATVALFVELGYALSGTGDAIEVSKPDPALCSSNCYSYTGLASTSPNVARLQHPTMLGAAQWYIGRVLGTGNGNCAGRTVTSVSVSGTPTAAKWTAFCTGGYNTPNQNLQHTPRAADPPGNIPSTFAELETTIGAQTGYPTSSAISAAITEAIKSGEVIDWDTVTVSGPATSPGTTTTSTKPDGVVVTTTTVNNHTYNDNRVSTKTTTTISSYNPSTGTTETTTTEEEKPPEKTECELNPDSLLCAELDTPSEQIPKDTEVIDFAEENVFGSGSCPANLTANIATLGSSVTVWDWQKTCELALPLRALVLGLATFAALLIVMPGSNRT